MNITLTPNTGAGQISRPFIAFLNGERLGKVANYEAAVRIAESRMIEAAKPTREYTASEAAALARQMKRFTRD